MKNGTYRLYVKQSTGKYKRTVTKLSQMDRICRAKVGNKLVTFTYSNNKIAVKVEKFKYKYDIVIDPGHGDNDPGAVNKWANEKDLNLEVSKYEKKRYEEHGLKVLMTRNGEKLQIGKGSKNWRDLYRRTYAMGYYIFRRRRSRVKRFQSLCGQHDC